MLLFGLAAFVSMIVISYFGNIVFDGIIQLHFADSELWKIVMGNVCNVSILTLGLLVLAKVLYPAVRLLDILNNVLVARIPLLFAGIITIPMQEMMPSSELGAEEVVAYFENLQSSQMIGFTAMAIAGLILLIYFFYLLVVGVKHSINSKKATHGVIIVLAILLLDVLATLVYRNWWI